MGVDCTLAQLRFVVRSVLVVAPCPGSINLSATGSSPPRAARQLAEETIYKTTPCADRSTLATTIIDFLALYSRRHPVTHPTLIVFSLLNSAR